MADGRHLEKAKNVVLMDIINSLLNTGNKTANINVKLQFIHTVNGDRSKKPQNIIYKGHVNHTKKRTFIVLN